MFPQIFLAVITATFSIALAYYYLYWKVMLWFGGLFVVASVVALFLNYQNDNLTLSIPASGLFPPGESVSILGDYQWLAIVSLLTGLTLMIAAVVKRIHIPISTPVTPGTEKPLTEKEKIEQALNEEIEKLQNTLDNPRERGKQDAHAHGGAFPHLHATAPEGFESAARERYQELGNSFVRNIISQLKSEIENALRKLNTLTSTLVKDYYASKATADYNENRYEIDHKYVADLQVEVTDAERDHDEFIQNLNLRSGQQPEWDKPTSNKQLVIFGTIFAIVEFLVSYYFLKDTIGSSRAITIALSAMVLVSLLAGALAVLFQFMRPPITLLMRLLATKGYLVLLCLLILGFGLLLDYREIEAKLSSGEITGIFKAILDGYASILTNLDNLTLFIINLIAFGLFYWKFLLWRERFHGYCRVGERLSQALDKWYAMSSTNSAAIKHALEKVSSEAVKNRKDAQQAVHFLQEKKQVLENIQTIIVSTFVQKLQPSYQDAVHAYRTSNKENRNLKVNPVPNYFDQAPSFYTAEEYFPSDCGIDDFLSTHKKDISQVDEVCKKIENAATEWQNYRAQLNAQWTDQFKYEIRQVKKS